MLGVLVGLAVGVAFKQQHPLAFATSTRASIVRAVLGNAGLMTMFEGVAMLTPDRPLALYATLRFVKYVLVPIYIIHVAPWAFVRMGI